MYLLLTLFELTQPLQVTQEGSKLSIRSCISFIKLSVEDNVALQHEVDRNPNRLILPLTDSHVAGQNLLKISSLPDGRIHGLELADQSLGKT